MTKYNITCVNNRLDYYHKQAACISRGVNVNS